MFTGKLIILYYGANAHQIRQCKVAASSLRCMANRTKTSVTLDARLKSSQSHNWIAR